MALTAIRDVRASSGIPDFRDYIIDADRVGNAAIASGRLAGIYQSGAKQGHVRDYDGSVANLRFCGVFVNGESIAPDGTTVRRTGVIDRGTILEAVPVTGSASAAVGALVYAGGEDPATDLTLTANGYDPVGRLVKQRAASSTSWDVEIFASYVGPKPSQAAPGDIGAATAYTADGAIALPTANRQAARLTGASSAAMTLAVPTAAILGMEFTIYRSAGSGTHDVDYTNEAGVAITHTFSASGDAITLLAVSTTGWRRIG